MGLFSYDSPFMNFLRKACEFMLTALLCILCCLPVITVGASVTAQYYVGMKLVRGEDTPFCRAFFKSFKENFKQATLIWLIEMALGAFLAWDWWLIYRNGGENFNQTLKILLALLTLFMVMAGIAIFPLIARFKMTTKEAIKGALSFSYIHFFRMLFIVLLTVLPTIASIKYFNWLMAILPIGSGVALYINSFHFMKTFKKLEEAIEQSHEES